METVDHCPVCGSSESSVALSAEDHTVSHTAFTIQRCGTCGFQYTSPRPQQDRIGEYYLSESYISHAEKATGLKDRIYHWVRKRAIRNKHKLIAHYQPTGSALDVGCGTGDFLTYLVAQGYSAQGVEVSPDAHKIAANKGVSVASQLADIPAQGQFNVISLWHVLEHVADPRETLKQLFERCSKGGLLVIAVPDNESWDCQHYGPKWAAWDVPRHLSHFRQQDVHKLLKETGFEILETKPMYFDAPYVSMLSEQYLGTGPVGSLVKGTVWGLWSNVLSLVSKRPTSSSLFLARKPETP